MSMCGDGERICMWRQDVPGPVPLHVILCPHGVRNSIALAKQRLLYGTITLLRARNLLD